MPLAMHCFTIVVLVTIDNSVQVHDQRDHFEEAAAETRKLLFLARRQERLPFTFWDPEAWTGAYQLGPTSTHKLVYLATKQQEQQCVVKFTQRYGVEAHKAWAAADLAPALLEHHQVAGTWRQIVMEYLPPELPD